MNHNKQIVCISTHYWDDPWFRKQQFMSRFVLNGHQVAYIEPSFSMMRKPDEYRGGYQTNKLFSVSVDRREDNLYIIKPPRGLPKWSNPEISRINYIYFSMMINRVLKKLNFEEYILWIYRPEYAPGADYFQYGHLVYDIADDLAAYKQETPDKALYIKKCMETLASKSSLVVVTASTLYDKFKKIAKNISLIPNGYNAELFNEREVEMPDDLREVNRPIIGFIGTLFSFLDYDLLEFIIKNNPDKSFVFVGNCEENSRLRWTEIACYSNVFWLGKKNKEDIPLYLNYFDICINPFKVDDVSRSVSPLKVFEYLAAKKPVVSVRMESLEKEEIAPFILFSSSYQEFHENIRSALNGRESFAKELDYQAVSKYSWDSLFIKLDNKITAMIK